MLRRLMLCGFLMCVYPTTSFAKCVNPYPEAIKTAGIWPSKGVTSDTTSEYSLKDIKIGDDINIAMDKLCAKEYSRSSMSKFSRAAFIKKASTNGIDYQEVVNLNVIREIPDIIYSINYLITTLKVKTPMTSFESMTSILSKKYGQPLSFETVMTPSIAYWQKAEDKEITEAKLHYENDIAKENCKPNPRCLESAKKEYARRKQKIIDNYTSKRQSTFQPCIDEEYDLAHFGTRCLKLMALTVSKGEDDELVIDLNKNSRGTADKCLLWSNKSDLVIACTKNRKNSFSVMLTSFAVETWKTDYLDSISKTNIDMDLDL